MVAFAGAGRTGETVSRGLDRSLRELGIQTTYLGGPENARGIAAAVAEEQADTVELCLGRGGVTLLRDLLRELSRSGRRHVSIVVHRTD